MLHLLFEDAREIFYRFNESTPFPEFLKVPDTAPKASTTPIVHPQKGRSISRPPLDSRFFARLDKALARFGDREFTVSQYEDLTETSQQTASLDLKRATVRGLAKGGPKGFSFIKDAVTPSGGITRQVRPISAESVGRIGMALANSFTYLDHARTSLKGSFFSAQDFRRVSSSSMRTALEALTLGKEIGIIQTPTHTHSHLYRFEESAAFPEFLKRATDEAAAKKTTPKPSVSRRIVDPEIEWNRPFFARLDKAIAHFNQRKFTIQEYKNLTKAYHATASLDLRRANVRGLATFDGGAYSFLPRALSASGHGVVQDTFPVPPDSLGPIDVALKNSLLRLERAHSSLKGFFSTKDFQKASSSSQGSARDALIIGRDMGFVTMDNSRASGSYRFEENAAITPFLKRAEPAKVSTPKEKIRRTRSPQAGSTKAPTPKKKIQSPRKKRRPPSNPNAIISTNADLEERRDRRFFNRLDHAYAQFAKRDFSQKEYQSSLQTLELNAELDLNRAIVRGLVRTKDGDHFAFNEGIALSTAELTREVLPVNSPVIGGDITHAFALLEEVRASGRFEDTFSLEDFYEYPSVLEDEAKRVLILGTDFGLIERNYSFEGDILYRFNEDVEVPPFLKVLGE